MGCGRLVPVRRGSGAAGARSHVPKMSVRGGSALVGAARSEPRGPLTLSARPSGKYTLLKKHIVGLCRDSEPSTRSSVPGFSISGVMPLRES